MTVILVEILSEHGSSFLAAWTEACAHLDPLLWFWISPTVADKQTRQVYSANYGDGLPRTFQKSTAG